MGRGDGRPAPPVVFHGNGCKASPESCLSLSPPSQLQVSNPSSGNQTLHPTECYAPSRSPFVHHLHFVTTITKYLSHILRSRLTPVAFRRIPLATTIDYLIPRAAAAFDILPCIATFLSTRHQRPTHLSDPFDGLDIRLKYSITKVSR